MKKYISIISFIICFVFTIPLNAENVPKRETKTIVLKKKPYKLPDQPLDPEGRRSVSQPIVAVISSAGLQISEISKTEILSYDIYDEKGESIVTFLSETEFVEYILNLTETVEVNILLHNYLLYGFID